MNVMYHQYHHAANKHLLLSIVHSIGQRVPPIRRKSAPISHNIKTTDGLSEGDLSSRRRVIFCQETLDDLNTDTNHPICLSSLANHGTGPP